MSISNSDKNRFRIGPGLELHDGDLIISRGEFRTSQINFQRVSEIEFHAKPPKLSDATDYYSTLFSLSPKLHRLKSSVEIKINGDFGDKYLLYRDIETRAGNLKQIESITEEFNRLHERAVEISKEIHGNIIYAWKTVRDKMDFDPEKITNRFKELSQIDASSIETTVPFVDNRSKLSRWIRPYTPEMRGSGQ